MRKFLALLALPLMLAVAACDAPPGDGTTPPADPAAPAAPADPAAVPAEPTMYEPLGSREGALGRLLFCAHFVHRARRRFAVLRRHDHRPFPHFSCIRARP